MRGRLFRRAVSKEPEADTFARKRETSFGFNVPNAMPEAKAVLRIHFGLCNSIRLFQVRKQEKRSLVLQIPFTHPPMRILDGLERYVLSEIFGSSVHSSPSGV